MGQCIELGTLGHVACRLEFPGPYRDMFGNDAAEPFTERRRIDVRAPCQVHGPVRVTPRSVGVSFGLPNESSLSVSKRRPLVWPSGWQVWQLNH